MAIKLVAAKYL